MASKAPSVITIQNRDKNYGYNVRYVGQVLTNMFGTTKRESHTAYIYAKVATHCDPVDGLVKLTLPARIGIDKDDEVRENINTVSCHS
jgi:hypothetical protein